MNTDKPERWKMVNSSISGYKLFSFIPGMKGSIILNFAVTSFKTTFRESDGLKAIDPC